MPVRLECSPDGTIVFEGGSVAELVDLFRHFEASSPARHGLDPESPELRPSATQQPEGPVPPKSRAAAPPAAPLELKRPPRGADFVKPMVLRGKAPSLPSFAPPRVWDVPASQRFYEALPKKLHRRFLMMLAENREMRTDDIARRLAINVTAIGPLLRVVGHSAVKQGMLPPFVRQMRGKKAWLVADAAFAESLAGQRRF